MEKIKTKKEEKMEAIIEREWYKDFPCVVIFQPGKFRCGYVGIPKEHPLFGLDTERLNRTLRVHGGITYSDYKLPIREPDGYWWIGWDAMHVGDRAQDDPGDGHFWTLEEAIQETDFLAEQLKAIDWNFIKKRVLIKVSAVLQKLCKEELSEYDKSDILEIYLL